MLTYLVCRWHRGIDGEPVVIYEELDEVRIELRKIHECRDGRLIRTDTINDTDTSLSWVPIRSPDEINMDPQFEATTLSADDFENMWMRAATAS